MLKRKDGGEMGEGRECIVANLYTYIGDVEVSDELYLRTNALITRDILEDMLIRKLYEGRKTGNQ